MNVRDWEPPSSGMPDGTGHPHLAEDARVYARSLAYYQEKGTVTWKDWFKAAAYNALAEADRDELAEKLRDLRYLCSRWIDDIEGRYP